MAEERKNLRAELYSYRFEYDFLQRVPCTEEQNEEYRKVLREGGSLPKGVYEYDKLHSEFYTVYGSNLTEAETKEYLMYKQISLIKTIKNCAVFFTVLTIIAIAISFIWVINANF